MSEVGQYALLAAAAFAAGAINSVAGGGTLLTFPALLPGSLSLGLAQGTPRRRWRPSECKCRNA
jgi:uncharacterized membrane protein YfcA